MTADLESWLKRGGHLPAPMKDFHDAKRLFKTMHSLMGKSLLGVAEKVPGATMPSWIDGQIYTVDFFLHFMARRGWTLQRSRASFEFRDLDADMQAVDDQMAANFNDMLSSVATSPAEPAAAMGGE